MLTTSITPRVSETDGAGHINNCYVPIWFEAGRREVFRTLTPDLDFRHWKVAMVKMGVEFEAQIYYHHDAEVRTWIDRVGTKSFTIAEEIWQGDRRCSCGTAVYVYFDYQKTAVTSHSGRTEGCLAASLGTFRYQTHEKKRRATMGRGSSRSRVPTVVGGRRVSQTTIRNRDSSLRRSYRPQRIVTPSRTGQPVWRYMYAQDRADLKGQVRCRLRR